MDPRTVQLSSGQRVCGVKLRYCTVEAAATNADATRDGHVTRNSTFRDTRLRPVGYSSSTETENTQDCSRRPLEGYKCHIFDKYCTNPSPESGPGGTHFCTRYFTSHFP